MHTLSNLTVKLYGMNSCAEYIISFKYFDFIYNILNILAKIAGEKEYFVANRKPLIKIMCLTSNFI